MSYYEPSQEERTLAFIAHLLGGFVSFLAPLIIWLVKRDQSPYVAAQAKEALNFQISMAIYGFIVFLSTFLLIGFVLMPLLILAMWILIVMASVKSLNGEFYEYPYIIRLIK